MSKFRQRLTRFRAEPEQAPELETPVAATVGQMLRAERIRQGLQIADVAEQLRIRRVILEALEDGRNRGLPGNTYAVGFVRSYARLLDLDAEELVDRFKAETGNKEIAPELNFPTPIAQGQLPGGVVLLVSAVVALAGYGLWYYSSVQERVEVERVAAVPQSIAPLVTERSASQASAATVPVAPPRPVVEAPPPAPPAVVPSPPQTDAAIARSMANQPPAATQVARADPAPPVDAVQGRTGGESEGRIVIRSTADSWVQVRDQAGQVVFMRILRAGDSYTVPNQPGLMLSTGNAGVLSVSVDGKAAPAIGRIGFVRRDVMLDADRLLAGTAAPGETR